MQRCLIGLAARPKKVRLHAYIHFTYATLRFTVRILKMRPSSLRAYTIHSCSKRICIHTSSKKLIKKIPSILHHPAIIATCQSMYIYSLTRDQTRYLFFQNRNQSVMIYFDSPSALIPAFSAATFFKSPCLPSCSQISVSHHIVAP